MFFRNRLWFLVLVLLFSVSLPCLADEGFKPVWKVGQHWTIKAQYRDLRLAKEKWLPPVIWRFHVRGEKKIAGQDCFALHITPAKKKNLGVQAILYLAKSDLHLVKSIELFPSRGKPQIHAQQADQSRISPVLSGGSMIPFDLPLFPLSKMKNKESKSAEVAGEHATTLDGLVFVNPVKQSWTPTEGGFQVILDDPNGKGKMVQIWKPGKPWATQTQSPTMKTSLEK
ncbi:hypothetical protein HYY75_10825 [bacterium]|nr:hypothetical protein [bacterium]